MADINKVKAGLAECAKTNCQQCPYFELFTGDCFDRVLVDALECIRELEVVRCAECKHYLADANKCTSWTIYTEPNGYCHRAERVEDEKEC